MIEYFKNGGMSFADFTAACDNVAIFAQRDLPELSTCGVTQAKIDDLKSSAMALLDNKSNIITGAEKKMKTKNRDNVFSFVSEKLSITKKQLSPIFNKIDSNHDTLIRKLHTEMGAKQFLVHCNDVLTVFKENKALLASVGFDDANITAFENDITLLKDAEREREQAEICYNNDTLERSEARRITYEKLDFIASMGRVYWKKKNQAKSQDYVLRRKKASKKATTTEDVEMEVVNAPINTENTENTGV